MTPYEKFQEAARNRSDSEKWAALIGKESYATARHKGTISAISAAITIHYQPSDGATNYHNAPAAFLDALQAVLRTHADELIKETLEQLRRAERFRLIECREFVNSISEAIDKAESAA